MVLAPVRPLRPPRRPPHCPWKVASCVNPMPAERLRMESNIPRHHGIGFQLNLGERVVHEHQAALGGRVQLLRAELAA